MVMGAGAVQKRKVVIKRIWIDVGHEIGMRDNSLHLGRKDEITVNKCEIERLHADAIARKRQRTVSSVPNTESIIALDPF